MIESLSDSAWTRRTADHLLFRAGFGGTPEEREGFFRVGAEGGVEAAVSVLVDAVEDWSAYPFPDWARNDGNGDALSLERRENEVTGWLLGQMCRAAGLPAKMLHFWLDHFPVDIGALPDDRRFVYLLRHLDILRTGAMGNFRTLVKRVSWSEGMMRMLDLDLSSRNQLNENWARELLELFTLGVDAGYSEADVVALSKIYTGRRLSDSRPYRAYLDLAKLPGGAWRSIDVSAQSLLGAVVPALGDGDDPASRQDATVDLITARPECGRHLVTKLWRYFAAPTIDSVLRDELAARFRDPAVHGFSIRGLLGDIFRSEAFYADSVVGRQVKNPVDWVVTTTRLLGGAELPLVTGALVLQELGFEPLRPPNIAGWPEPERAGNQWLSAGLMMFRINAPVVWTHRDPGVLTRGFLAAGEQAGELDWDAIAPHDTRGEPNLPLLLDELERRFLPFHRISEVQRRVLRDFHRHWRRPMEVERLRDILRFVLALPEFQLQ